MIILDRDDVFYVEAEGDDSFLRTARKKLYKHIEPLEEVEDRLPSPPFFRIHRSYIVNLDRVYELRSRGDGEWEVKMEEQSAAKRIWKRRESLTKVGTEERRGCRQPLYRECGNRGRR